MRYFWFSLQLHLLICLIISLILSTFLYSALFNFVYSYNFICLFLKYFFYYLRLFDIRLLMFAIIFLTAFFHLIFLLFLSLAFQHHLAKFLSSIINFLMFQFTLIFIPAIIVLVINLAWRLFCINKLFTHFQSLFNVKFALFSEALHRGLLSWQFK